MAKLKKGTKAIPKWYVTVAMLRKEGACSYEVNRFRLVFGDGKVFFTKQNWDRAVAADLDVIWLARRVLSWNIYYDIYWAIGRDIENRMFAALERKRRSSRITIA